jgi:signal transduction histidine kinase
MHHTPILIIDDEDAVLEGLGEFLEDEGYTVYKAQDGSSGLKVFRSVKPDLVMTDLRMPGMSGIELISEIRKLKENTPVIVFTGYGSLGTAIDAIHLKVFDFLTKPIDLDSLKDTLDRARRNVQVARQVQDEMGILREQLLSFQTRLQEQLVRFSEVEPLIQTGRLLAGILHDLNNPLMHIMGQAECLQMLHPEIENLAVIQGQARRMGKIVSAIMQRLKLSQSRRLEWMQLNKLLEEEVFFMECQPFFKHEIEKEWQLEDNLPLVRGIPAEMNQVFGNIIRNAAEAMIGQPQKRLTIRTAHDAAGIHVSIQDTGAGIPRHLQNRIFESFFSTKSGASGMMGSMGMGIGLYSCKELVQQYGGHIELVSEPGAGTTFHIHLPTGAEEATHGARSPER